MIKRLNNRIIPDPNRVILQFLNLDKLRSKRIINQVLQLSENETSKVLNKVFKEFSKRHKNYESKLFSNYQKVSEFINFKDEINNTRKLLIGSYFSKEYSISSAALFNPSIVPHPEQKKLGKGSLRFVMSLRATGEGHISSIEFREGVIDEKSNVKLIKNSRFCNLPNIEVTKQKNSKLDKFRFINPTEEKLKDLLDSNYTCSFDNKVPLNERVIFPHSYSESVGMEDVRLVKFSDNKSSCYYGTYTAYNGKTFRTQLIQTKEFKDFKISTLHGKAIKDKGMALFPRRINNKFIIVSRQDGENLFIMESDNIFQWESAERLKAPEQPWEYIQVGNCGSPIETDKGWILITHAVGPMRKYVISAILLDLENPSKVIGSLKQPLIEPNEDEREGYVPNVVYSCGSIVHKNNLIIPYAFSDSASGFGKIGISELLDKLN